MMSLGKHVDEDFDLELSNLFKTRHKTKRCPIAAGTGKLHKKGRAIEGRCIKSRGLYFIIEAKPLQRKLHINPGSQLQSCCSEDLKGMRRRFEVPIRRKGSDRFGHNHQRLRASERCHNLEASFLGLHSCLGVESSFERQG